MDEPLNEWVVSEWSRVLDQLRDLMRRHEEIVNHLADVCRRNDRMRSAGDNLVSLLSQHEIEEGKIELAIQEWGEANT